MTNRHRFRLFETGFYLQLGRGLANRVIKAILG